MVDHSAIEATKTSRTQLARRRLETYSTMSKVKKKLNDVEAEAVHIRLIRISNDIYLIVDACPSAQEMWKVVECLMR
nr:hypothetical protein [Tanacetum cinerariifolium]